ncbi:Ribose-5-phosphate isomerase B [Actinomyces bovis]|uniref:Ribose-5-phosphate isomerase B n=1 Tax=Actinomyces bovis TaxID=1658 RepID=A0ABY1VL08_9ACTO|nr:ribose-5-phosphate isomerase [Actinomyces bovis]SPT52700.1 Ribose-5-phosphate isomerase B [Actinomyces bovis]VEG54644.1 Ribose-5-phosphate isomerase B [Actinomyces israelii]
MRIHIATDHAGFELKNRLAEHLRAAGHEVIDHGAHEYDALDDYPAFCIDCGQAVVADPGSLGVVIGGSGNGEQIAANKVDGVRAALVWNEETARLAREHNNANIISIGFRQHELSYCFQLVDVFIAEPFSGDERHLRRIGQISAFEAERD